MKLKLTFVLALAIGFGIAISACRENTPANVGPNGAGQISPTTDSNLPVGFYGSDGYYREKPNFCPAPPPAGVHFVNLQSMVKTGNTTSDIVPWKGHAEMLYLSLLLPATVGNSSTLMNRADVPPGSYSSPQLLTCDLDSAMCFSAVVFGPHRVFPKGKYPTMHFNFSNYGLSADQMIGMKIWYYNYDTQQWELVVSNPTIDPKRGEITCIVPHWSTYAFGY